jgi:serine protease Do
MKKYLLFGVLAVMLGLAIGLGLSAKLNISTLAVGQGDKPTPAAPASGALTPHAVTSSFEGFSMEDAVINVASTTGKAVVSISSERTEKIGTSQRFYSMPFGGSPNGEDEFFHRFFDDFFGQMPQREYKQVGLGSGVIIDQDGFILTNDHVIAGADKITVTLPDGREFKGEVKGHDARSDLAVVKINARDLPVATLGDSNAVRIGQWAVAIGNPFGFAMENPEPTVTVGVISALHRSLGRTSMRDRDYGDLIQTDAAINPGNSGGPLANLKGEVIGINVAIFSTTGGYEGVGFAIPINNAKRIIASLIQGKKILYGWLGVTVQDLNEDMAKYFGLSAKTGVLVAKVLDNSPAQKAGIKDSDIIREFDGKPVKNVRELLSVVGQSEVGRKAKAVIIRDKKEMTVEIEVGQRPQDLEKVTEEAKKEEAAWRGLTVQAITPDVAQRFRIPEKSGVIVSDVDPGSPADEGGIVPGDVIVEINRTPVAAMEDYDRLTKEAKGNALVRTARGYFLIKTGE